MGRPWLGSVGKPDRPELDAGVGGGQIHRVSAFGFQRIE